MSTGQEVLAVQPEFSEKVGYLTGMGRGLEFGYPGVSELTQCQKLQRSILFRSIQPNQFPLVFFSPYNTLRLL